MIKKIFYLAFLLIAPLGAYSKGSVSAYLYFEDPLLAKEEIKGWAESIYLNSKAKITDFGVFQNLMINAFDDDFKGKKKKSCAYRTITIDCKYDRCINLNTLINAKGVTNLTLYVSDDNFDCSNLPFDLSKSRFEPTKTGISEIINTVIKENKKLKKDIKLLFFISSNISLSKPILTFENDTLQPKAGESVMIQGEIDNATKYEWSPRTGLSCFDCPNPRATVSSEITYTLTASNEHCSAQPKRITIMPEEEACIDCLKTKICFEDCIGKKAYWANDHYVLVARSSGSPRFDFITSSNCGKRFKFELINKKGEVVFTENFKRNEVDERANNYYHKIGFADNFVFSVNLSTSWSRIDQKEFTVVITSYSGSNEVCGIYASEDKVSFRPCADD